MKQSRRMRRGDEESRRAIGRGAEMGMASQSETGRRVQRDTAD